MPAPLCTHVPFEGGAAGTLHVAGFSRHAGLQLAYMQATTASETSTLPGVHVALSAKEQAMQPSTAPHCASSVQHFASMHVPQSPGSKRPAHAVAPLELAPAPPLAPLLLSLLHAQGTSASAPATQTHPVARMSNRPPEGRYTRNPRSRHFARPRAKALPSGAK
jgi:hypothetical protein